LTENQGLSWCLWSSNRRVRTLNTSWAFGKFLLGTFIISESYEEWFF